MCDLLDKSSKYILPNNYEDTDYKHLHPFNHYDSPYPDLAWIRKKEQEIFSYRKKPLGINFNDKVQFNFLNLMNSIDLLPWTDNEKNKNADLHYYYNNGWFGKGSADILYYMIRILKPKKIVEIGSGFSTAVMIDTNKMFFNNNIEIISIEPRPERLKRLLKKDDDINIIEKPLQDIPLNFFNLSKNDILFIDSSHVAKIGSDVNYYLFDLFPSLSCGVYIHLHDIYYPFEYPKKYIFQGRAYNEIYIIRSFMMYNTGFSVQFFGEYLMYEYKKMLPLKLSNINGSLWIKKEM